MNSAGLILVHYYNQNLKCWCVSVSIIMVIYHNAGVILLQYYNKESLCWHDTSSLP